MDYRKMYEDTMKAYEGLIMKTMEKATDDDLKQLDVLKKRMEEFEGLMSMEERKLPAQPKEENLTESQKYARRFVEAVATRSTFDGAMPREMAASVIEKIGQYANLVDKCTVHELVADLAISVDAGLPTVNYVAEGEAIGESDAEIGTVVLSPKMLACISKVSNVLMRDVTFDIVAYVEGAVARAIANKLDSEILFGAGGSTAITGITKTTGIVSATSATTLTLTWAEVTKALDSLGGYKKNATVVMSQTIATLIHSFKDDNGNYIFHDQNAPLTEIQGCKVVISDQMPIPATGKALLVAGDFAQYAFGKREEVEVQILYELYANKNQTGIKTTVRCDGKVAIPEAFSVIVSK